MFTLAPTVTSEDSGELITAAYLFGVPHPPGYPLWCILAKFFSLLPIANIAFRINLMSAFFGILTTIFLYLTCNMLIKDRFSAFISSLLMAFSLHFWSQSVIAEVYTLNAFLFSCIVYLVLVTFQYRVKKYLFWAAFLWGLSLTNHYMLMLLVSPPVFIYAAYKQKETRLFSLRDTIAMFLLSVFPLIVYAYLPLASMGKPAIDWGHTADSLANFWAHISRKSYKNLELGESVPVNIKLIFLGHYIVLLLKQFTPYIFIFFLLLSMKSLFKKYRDIFFLLWGVILFNSLVLICILSFTPEKDNFTRVEEYYLLSYYCFSIFICAGLYRVKKILKEYSKHLVLALCLLPIIPLISHFKENDYAHYYLAYDLNRAVLESLPEEAIYFPGGDHMTFATIYLHFVEKIRPDVTIVNIEGEDSYLEDENLHRKLGIPLRKYSREGFKRYILQRTNKPLFVAQLAEVRERHRYKIESYGNVYQVLRKNQSMKMRTDMFNKVALRNLALECPLDYFGSAIVAHYYRMWGESMFRRGRRKDGLRYFNKAFQIESERGSKKVINNMANRLSELNLLPDAIRYYRKAANLYPEYLTPRRNLHMIYQNLGARVQAFNIENEIKMASLRKGNLGMKNDLPSKVKTKNAKSPREMIGLLKKSIEKDPNNPTSFYNMGVAFALLKDGMNAEIHLKKALELNPSYVKAMMTLSRVYRGLIGDEQMALYWKKQYEKFSSKEK